MASRAGGRSQRAGPSQSQRRQEQIEDVDEEVYEDGDVEMNGEDGNSAGDDLERKANDLARLALFSEHKRTPLRRDEIGKKVLGSSARAFPIVFQRAQVILRRTFGMELVELHRGQTVEDAEEAQTGTGMRKKVAASGTKSYILRSVLDPVIIEHASLTDAHILEEEVADQPDFEDEDEGHAQSYGSIINWSNSDQLNALGILHVILALILVNGRVISDIDLRAHLKRLRLDSGTNIPYSIHATQQSQTVDAFLSQCQRQGYVERSRMGDAQGGTNKASGGKRGRAAVATQGGVEDAQYEWRWGPRAAAEIGELGIARFVADFMVERKQHDDRVAEDEDEEDDPRAIREREKKRQAEAKSKLLKVMTSIERSAGGALSDVR